jgi:hypothetical protein
MWRYPALIAEITACSVSAGGIWNTPKPSTGICTPLFNVMFCMMLSPVCSHESVAILIRVFIEINRVWFYDVLNLIH